VTDQASHIITTYRIAEHMESLSLLRMYVCTYVRGGHP